MRAYVVSTILAVICWFSNCVPTIAQDRDDRFKHAFEQGMVDVSGDYWSRENPQALLNALKAIHPGIVNRFGFLFGGPSIGWIDQTSQIAKAIHAAVPDSLLGAVLPEALYKDYSIRLACEGKDITFAAGEMVSDTVQGADVFWIDLSRPESRIYYLCLGEQFIAMGFRLIHFEAPGLVLEHSADRVKAQQVYAEIASTLRLIGHKNGEEVYLSGDTSLSNEIPLDALYMPARFYHNDSFALRYRNKINRPGIGVGYSYVLSSLLIRDVKSATKFNPAIFFYVDNWDSEQDDLRRFMELDPENRRYLIAESEATARENGVGFSIPLEHCDGCVPLKYLGDNCEKWNDGRSKYDAVQCGDVDVIKNSLAKKETK